jgi:hypothetical protein
MTVALNMKFQFHLKNGKTHEFTLPDDDEIHRAIVWISKENKKELTRIIIIPDSVESVEVLDAETV